MNHVSRITFLESPRFDFPPNLVNNRLSPSVKLYRCIQVQTYPEGSIQMLGRISHRFVKGRRRIALTLVPIITFTIVTPMTVSCQRVPVDHESGLEELRNTVRAASGRPSVEDLTRFESRYPRNRTAALARFLRGYL